MPVAVGITQIARLNVYPTSCTLIVGVIICGNNTLILASVFNVKVGANNLPIPTGTVTFIDQDTGLVFGTVSLVSASDHGSALLNIPTIASPAASYNIVAIYNGVHNSFASSISNIKLTRVSFKATTTTVTTTPGSSFAHTNTFAMSAHVVNASTPVTVGSVTFNLFSNNTTFTVIGTANLNGSGNATVNIPANSTQAGKSYYIQATYNGSGCFAQSLSPNGVSGTIIHST